MARQSNRSSHSSFLQKLFEPYKYHTDIPYRGDFGSSTIRPVWNFASKWRKQLLYLVIAAIVGTFVALVVLAAGYVNDSNGLDSSSLDFALYKNTAYHQCSSIDGPCNAGFNNLAPTDGAIEYDDSALGPQGFCNCFSDWKIIPSTPRNSAFAYNGFYIWITETVSFIFSIYTMVSMIETVEEDPDDWRNMHLEYEGYQYGAYARGPQQGQADKPERKFSDVFLFGGMIYDAISFVGWWHGFISLALKPAFASRLSILGWLTPWKYILASGPKQPLHRYISDGACTVLALVMAVLFVLQWAASIVTIYLTHFVDMNVSGTEPYIRYDFSPAFFNDAPGSTNCTAGDIESAVGLFTSPVVQNLRYSTIIPSYMICFVVNSIFAIYAAWRYLSSMKKRSPPLAGYALFLVFLGLSDYTVMAISISGSSSAASTVLVYQACNAVHLTMSPYKGYFDIPGNIMGWRVLKGWLNI